MTLRDGDRRTAAEQLELPLDQQPSTPVVGKILRSAAVATEPPRIPAGDQRLIRLLGAGVEAYSRGRWSAGISLCESSASVDRRGC